MNHKFEKITNVWQAQLRRRRKMVYYLINGPIVADSQKILIILKTVHRQLGVQIIESFAQLHILENVQQVIGKQVYSFEKTVLDNQ